MLARMGEPLPARVVAGDWWNEGRAVYGGMRLANGARVDGAWIQLLDTFEYRETIQFMFAEEVHTLEFPSPWLKQSPTVYRRSRRAGRADEAVVRTAFDESFSRELRHFHACIAEGEACRTPPEGARLDIEVLTAMFLALELMRAAIVGTGFIARVHALALQSLGVEVVAVAGSHRVGPRSSAWGRRTAISASCSTRESIDVLHVCTPNDVHAAQALAAIERGVHVVCEKPLAVSTAESGAMVEAAEAEGS